MLAGSRAVGFLVLLDRLGPSERVAFLLGEVFGEPYAVIGASLGKTEAACRQLASRARRKVRAAVDRTAGRRRPASAERLRELLGAVLAGDSTRAPELLHPDAGLVSDTGPSRRAARHPVVGAVRVRRLISGGWRLFGHPERLTGIAETAHLVG